MNASSVSVVAVILAATAFAHADAGKSDIVNGLQLPTAAAPAVLDHVTVATKTTITRGTGKQKKTAVRSESSRTKITKFAADGTVLTAAVKYSVPTVTGTWPARVLGVLVNNENLTLTVNYDPEATTKIVADPIANVSGDPDRPDISQAETVHLFARSAWARDGMPMRGALSGKTFTQGTTVNLGGQDIEIVYGGLDRHSWASLPGGSITYQSKVDGVATFAVATTLTLALADGTKVTGAVTGTLTVDTATARVTAVAIEGDLGTGDALLHLAHTQTLTYKK